MALPSRILSGRILPGQIASLEPRRIGRVALTALVLGFGVAAVSALPLAGVAVAEKGGNGNGGGGGGEGGGNGGAGGNGGGKSGDHGGNGNGQGHGHGQGGAGSSAKAGKSDATTGATSDAAAGDDTADDDSLNASNLGKLNGFFHASPNALANAAPDSAIGKISQTFRDALSDYAAANPDDGSEDGTETDAGATPPTGPSVADLGAILAGATNKPVTAAQVQAIIDRLAEQNPDDAALHDLADNPDDQTVQGIADAANAAKTGQPVDESDDDSTDETPVTAAN
jgi:hypothetical protein